MRLATFSICKMLDFEGNEESRDTCFGGFFILLGQGEDEM